MVRQPFMQYTTNQNSGPWHRIQVLSMHQYISLLEPDQIPLYTAFSKWEWSLPPYDLSIHELSVQLIATGELTGKRVATIMVVQSQFQPNIN